MRFVPKFNLSSAVAAIFAPTDRFFLRLVPLVPDLPAAGQVELALEEMAPFPAAQLYWGCCVAPDRTQALVYAAHRRRFTPEDTAAWERADVVVPDLLALLGSSPTGAAIIIQAGDNRLSGAAWSGQAAWPVAVHTRAFSEKPTEDSRRQFAAELASKAGLTGAPVRFVTGTPRARREGDSLFFELLDVAGSVIATTPVARADQNALDIRDPAFLEKRRRSQNRGEFIWKVLLGGVAAAVLAAVFDAGALTFSLLNRALHIRIAAQAPFVERLETAHTLVSRVDELAHRRLRFFEMVSTINESRPHSIQFTRTGTSGYHALEIEAQTNTADDVGTYESALRKLPALEKAEIHDLRARDGVTTFGLSVVFKIETAPGGTP
jgi:hypothetical protein